MTPAAAESVLKWKFNDEAMTRMNELAEKARCGTLTEEEEPQSRRSSDSTTFWVF